MLLQKWLYKSTAFETPQYLFYITETTKYGGFTRPNNNVRNDERYDGEDDNGGRYDGEDNGGR